MLHDPLKNDRDILSESVYLWSLLQCARDISDDVEQLVERLADESRVYESFILDYYLVRGGSSRLLKNGMLIELSSSFISFGYQ